MLNTLLAIIQKEMTEAVKNRTVFFSIAFPVFTSLLFSLVFQSQESPKLKLAVSHAGNSRIIQLIKKIKYFEVVEEKDIGKAKELVKNKKVHGLLILPHDVDEKMDAGERPQLELFINVENIHKASILEIALNKMLYLSQGDSPPAIIVMKKVYGDNYTARTASIPFWLFFTIMGGYMIVSSSIIEEKDNKTLSALLVTPCDLPVILLGKGLTGFILAVCGSLVILGLNQGFIGNITGLILIILSGSAFFSCLGSLMGLLLPGQTGSNTFGSLLFSFFFLPVALADAGPSMLSLARVLPSYYIYQGIFQSMFANCPLISLSFHFAYLMGMTVIVFIINLFILNKRESL